MDLFQDFIGPSLCCFMPLRKSASWDANAFCSNRKLYLQFKNAFKWLLSNTLGHESLHKFWTSKPSDQGLISMEQQKTTVYKINQRKCAIQYQQSTPHELHYAKCKKNTP